MWPLYSVVELHSAQGRDGQTDAWMDGCRNLQNGIGAAPEKSASSKSMLVCVPMSCRELARKGSNFRVWFGKWFSLKIAIFEGLLSAGIQSPACSQKHLPCCSRAWWKVEEECLSGSWQPWISWCHWGNNPWAWGWGFLTFHIPACIDRWVFNPSGLVSMAEVTLPTLLHTRRKAQECGSGNGVPGQAEFQDRKACFILLIKAKDSVRNLWIKVVKWQTPFSCHLKMYCVYLTEPEWLQLLQISPASNTKMKSAQLTLTPSGWGFTGVQDKQHLITALKKILATSLAC